MASIDQQEKVKPGLGGVPETMLLTLNVRRQDAEQAKPLLGDRWAPETLRRLDYNFRRIMTSPVMRHTVCARALQLDLWAADFLRRNATANVVHLACGLDSRCLRLDWACDGGRGRERRWFDVDLPEVVSIRNKVMPRPDGDYTLLAMSVLDPALPGHIPADRPTLIIAEGLFPYLDDKDVRALVGRMVRHFPRGELCFDTCHWASVWMMRTMTYLSGVTIHIQGSAHRLERDVANIRLRDAVGNRLATKADVSSWWLWLALFFWACAPVLRRSSIKYRYTFGP